MKTPNSALPPCTQVTERFCFPNTATQYLCSIYSSGAYSSLQSRAGCSRFAQRTGTLWGGLAVAFPNLCTALPGAIGSKNQGTLSLLHGLGVAPLLLTSSMEKKNRDISLFSLPKAFYSGLLCSQSRRACLKPSDAKPELD